MKKTLIALAVAALPMAAQADSGNVTIYGQANASIDLTKTGDATGGPSGANQTKVSSNASRIGFKGTEDMGNGLSAVWQLEEGFNVDGSGTNVAGGNTMSSRNTFVGLSSKTAGTAILGRHDTPYKLATRGLDNFADTIADNRSIMGIGYDVRANDVIAYISPTVSGFHAAIAYVAGAEAAANGQTKGDAWSATGIYSNGPIFASLAYQTAKMGTSNSGTLGLEPVGSPDLGKSEKAWKLGLGYTMDAFKVGFAYEHMTDDFAVHEDRNAWTLNGSYTMGSNVLKAAYIKANNVGSMANTGAKQFTLGVDHNMSKRTSVYALYSKLTNDAAAAYVLGGSGGAAVAPLGISAVTTGAVTPSGAGAAPSVWSFGITHAF